jgi:hypothetical protein
VAAENVVAAHPELGFGIGGQAVADLAQPRDQGVQRSQVVDLQKFFDTSTHTTPPRSPETT